MAQGTAAARDLRYGRRGGRWATDTGTAPNRLEYLLGDFHRTRLAAVAKGPDTLAGEKGPPWPAESVRAWCALAAEADRLPPAERTDTHRRALEVRTRARAAGWPV